MYVYINALSVVQGHLQDKCNTNKGMSKATPQQPGLYIRTWKSSAFRTLIDTLKELFTEIPIICNYKGMSMSSMDPALGCFVHFELPRENFESYSCEQSNQYLLSINVKDLAKKMQQVKSEEELCFTMDRTDSDTLVMYRINSRTNRCTRYTIPIISFNSQIAEAPPIDSTHHIKLQSLDFKEICFDIKKTESDTVQITCDDSHILFEGTSFTGGISVFINETTEADESAVANADDDNDEDPKKSSKPTKPSIIKQFTTQDQETFINKKSKVYASGKYLIQYLTYFCKATPMSHIVKLYITSKKKTLVLNYNVGELGTLKLFLAAFGDTAPQDSEQGAAADSNTLPPPPPPSFDIKKTGKTPIKKRARDNDDDDDNEDNEQEEEEDDDGEESTPPPPPRPVASKKRSFEEPVKKTKKTAPSKKRKVVKEEEEEEEEEDNVTPQINDDQSDHETKVQSDNDNDEEGEQLDSDDEEMLSNRRARDEFVYCDDDEEIE